MNTIELDKKYIWHPYTSLQSEIDVIPILKAQGVELFSEDGSVYLDAISSWWVNVYGHNHPFITKAIQDQAEELSQVIFAGFTHPKAVKLGQELCSLLGGTFTKVFYSDNGSTAVEVALKMAIQYWKNQGKNKSKILAMHGAYHGDTWGAMSVSERGSFTASFSDLLFEVLFFPFPDAENVYLKELEKLIHQHQEEIAALIIEPLIQGSAGMRMYNAEQLQKIFMLCEQYNILIISDEVFTGFGRTGKNFAYMHQAIFPDIVCLSKGITGGYMPFGATVCNEKVVEAFNSTDKNKTLFHGHSYTGNALSCAASLASIYLLTSKDMQENITRIQQQHSNFLSSLGKFSNVLNPRVLGTILAFEYVSNELENNNYFHSTRDYIYRYFIDKKILIRPLGNTIYILPPYIISNKELDVIYLEIIGLLEK